MRTSLLLVAATAIVLSGCGSDSAPVVGGGPDEPVSQPAAGMCAPGVTDCVDTVVVDDDATRERAEELLGMPEAELRTDVRIGRRGDEQFALTEDYAVGRLTAELDEDLDGNFVVTSVVAELEAGPETFVLE